ncbi:MAG TPA: LysM peptidoglycan-binding domain-containing protein [Polyangiales bacterium]|nr:LysM peptidoglycan-binding domain-containing protein [Polyangiales bacterium]
MWSHAVRDRRRRAARLWSCVVLALCVPRLAAADPPPHAAGKRPTQAAPDPEVELELQAARKELLALVAREAQERRDQPRESAPLRSVSQGVPPPSMTSAAPPPKPATPAPRRTRLDWLEGLKLPDLPVRWDDRLVRLLEYYKNDARGRAIMRGLLQRKGRYEALLRAKLRAAQLPEDLSYLAMVESAYDPRAKSDAGAVGIWQLMTAPAGEYGLEITKWVDERMNVSRATDATLLYLRDLYADLGSWPLSMAAFNMGSGALLRAVQKYNTNDFWVLSNLEAGLPFETVNYVTKVSAFAIIGHNAARFGVGDVVQDPPVELADVALPGGTSLSRVARSAGMTVEELTALNPELKRGRLPPDEKTWDVHLPKDRLARFRERWATQGTGLPSHRTHVLRLGERLGDVAETYGTSVAKLYKLNDVVEGTSLRAGAKLRVPDVEPTPRASGEPPTVGVLGDRFVYADRKRVFYRVADGDELREIARFFSVTTDEILLWNRVSHDCKLQRGMFLQLYVPADADLTQTIVLAPNEVRTMVVGSEEFFNFHESQQNRQRIRYRVKPGDTLKSLADRFDLSIGSLARINRFGRDTKLTPNSEIIVYVPESAAKKVPDSTPKKLGPKASR